MFMANTIARSTTMVHIVVLPPLIYANWSWRERSACREMGTDMFYPAEKERGSAKRVRIAAAKSVCRTCPVQRPCLKWALDVEEPFGVWGETTPEERKQIQTGRDGSAGDGRRIA
jgi:WhiB family redox-sensing transcriptional regulator